MRAPRLRRLLRPTSLKLALTIAAGVALFYFLSFAGSGRRAHLLPQLEAKVLDLKLRMRGPLPPSGRVTVAAVDERSVSRFGRWPWDRSVLARLVDRLTEDGARVIALDMGFTDPSEGGRWEALEEAQEVYRRAVAEAPTGAGLQGVAAGPRRLPDLESFLAEEVGRGDPDSRLARSIFRSGRVVWGLFGHFQADDGAKLTPAQLNASFERVAPFGIQDLYRLKLTDFGMMEQPDEALAVDDPRLRCTEIRGGIESPLPILSAATPFFGLMNATPDPDGVMRRSDLVARYHGVLFPSLPLAAVAAYLNSAVFPMRDLVETDALGRIRLRVASAEEAGLGIMDGHGPVDWLERRAKGLPASPWEAPWIAEVENALETRIQRVEAGEDLEIDPVTIDGFEEDETLDVPLDPWRSGTVLVNHLGPYTAYPRVSVADVLEGTAPKDRIAGRIVLVGVTAIGTYDQRVSPFDSSLPGVFIQAALTDQLLTGRFIERPNWLLFFELLALLGLGALVGLVLPRLRGGLAIVLFIVAGVAGWALVDGAAFAFAHLDVFTLTPIGTFLGLTLSGAVFQWLVVDQEKRQVRRAFQHYLAPSVLETVLRDPKKLALEPGKAELTVLFSDIRGFTTISERLPAEELATVLNEYLTPMTHIVFRNGGTLDKYMGDAIMAFWGDPVPQEDHALRACRTALEMQAEVDRLSRVFTERGWPALSAGVGINTGTMSVGNFGSDVLFDYTVMGDAVNLASRLEGANKQYGSRVIVSEFTEAQVRGRVVVRELDSVRVKGKQAPVRIYELLALGAPSEADRAWLEAFAEGLARYKAQAWEEAISRFQDCLARRPEDPAAQMYVARCREMQQTPPGADWDGVYTFTRK